MLIDFLSKYLKDRKGNKFYAKSHVDAIYTRDGGVLGDKIEELENNSGGSGMTGSGHTHSNKSILDSITKDKINSWDNKVDKVDGMGLSQENFTTSEKERLQGLSNYDDTALSERIGNVEQNIPNLATKEYVSQEIANSNSLTKEIVDSIPSNDEALDNVIYMLKITDENGDPAGYQQYTKINGTVQFIGDTDIDLTGYAKTNELNAGLESKVNKTDIVDNLASNESDKPLSAKQGKELKELIDSNNNGTSTHINDSSIHITPADKTKLHEHTNKSLLDSLLSSGNGLKYLADDGTYKELFVKSTTQPTDENAIWIDISDNTNILLKIFNDGTWNTISGSGGSSSGGSSITIDNILDATSTNPVQNKVIKKYIDNINTNIENIKTELEPKVLYHKFKNTELDYGVFEIESMTSSKTNPLIFTNLLYGNMQISDNNFILLKQSKSYCIQYSLYNVPYARGVFLMDQNLNIIDKSTTSKGSFIYKPENDIEITLAPDVDTTIDPEFSCVNVFEIGRETVIDPVEYVNTTQGIEDTPVGHIIPYMGNNAPAHYLICDGTEYNITDYPYLAQHIKNEFGSVNYFGGNGEATFAVPDLRGEFLRGTGNNSHINQGSGDDVGIHQDATEHLNLHLNQYKYITVPIDYNKNSNTIGQYNIDSNADIVHSTNAIPYVNTASGSENYIPSHYTSRPTNTSVLYCIKYEPTYYMQNTFNTNDVYSTEEMIVGRWIDGKPLYQKTIQLQNTNNYDLSDIPVDKMINLSGTLCNNDNTLMIFTSSYINGSFSLTAYYDNSDKFIHLKIPSNFKWAYITIQYTKISDVPLEGTINNTTCNCVSYTDEEIATGISDILGGVN